MGVDAGGGDLRRKGQGDRQGAATANKGVYIEQIQTEQDDADMGVDASGGDLRWKGQGDRQGAATANKGLYRTTHA